MPDDIDYIAPGLAFQAFAQLFPDRIEGDKQNCYWPYLRKNISHKWYVDRRQPLDGFLNIDETSILVAAAVAIGGRGLEIGSHRGWSTVHLAAVLDHLDVIDPVFFDESWRKETEAVLHAAGLDSRVALISGYSPDAIDKLAQQGAGKWSFAFIDGNHDGQGPFLDATAVETHMEDSSSILFHDLNAPAVAAGYRYLETRGWRCTIYNTMQIMGLACRGSAVAPAHLPDPNQIWQLPKHLCPESASL